MWLVASSAAVALCFTAVQLAVEYRDLRRALDRQLEGVGIYVETLEGSLWDFDERQLQRVIDALVLVPGVAQVRVTDASTGRQWSAGNAPSSGALARVVPLHHDVRGEAREIGTVELVASVEGIRRQVIARAATTLASNALLTAVVALVMVVLLRRLVTARLERMAARVRALAPALLPAGPAAAPPPMPAALDELDAVDWALTRATEDVAAALAALQRSEEQLRQSQKLEAVGRLAAGVAHDFNNLLTAILGDAEVLAEGLPEGAQRDGALEIQAAAQRAALLTRQLLAFGRRQAARPRVLDLNEVVASMDRMLRRLIGEDVELVTAQTPGLWSVLADPGQIEQVIVNLAVNARDAMPEGGRLVIETANVERCPGAGAGAPARPCVRLAVRDTGSGMGPEVRAHLFEPFFTTKAPGKGTGLGLSTVYGIVKQCGGDVWVASSPGEGSTFEVHLPRVDAAPEPLAAPAGARAAAPGTETVLVVDDEAAIRSVAARMLRGAGYSVLVAADGDEALALAASAAGRELGLLVTDVVLPRLDGRELATRLRAASPGLPVLFVSGYTDRVVDLAAFGEADFLAKPFSAGDLTSRVRELLDRARTPAGGRESRRADRWAPR